MKLCIKNFKNVYTATVYHLPIKKLSIGSWTEFVYGLWNPQLSSNWSLRAIKWTQNYIRRLVIPSLHTQTATQNRSSTKRRKSLPLGDQTQDISTEVTLLVVLTSQSTITSISENGKAGKENSKSRWTCTPAWPSCWKFNFWSLKIYFSSMRRYWHTNCIPSGRRLSTKMRSTRTLGMKEKKKRKCLNCY